MTDTTDTAATSGANPRGGLHAKKLDELKAMAGGLGIKGTSKMRKSDLVAAIQGAGRPAGGTPSQASTPPAATAPTQNDERRAAAPATEPPSRPAEQARPEQERPQGDSGRADASEPQDRQGGREDQGERRRERRQEPRSGDRGQRGQQGPDRQDDRDDSRGGHRNDDRNERGGNRSDRNENRGGGNDNHGDRDDSRNDNRNERGGNRNNDRNDNRGGNRNDRDDNRGGNRNDRNENRGGGNDRDDQRGDRGGNDRNDRNDNRNDRGGNRNNDRNERGGNRNDNRGGGGNDHDNDGRGRRRQRGRDRKRGRRGDDFGDIDTQVREDDVLVPVGGILDVLDNYAFVRTSGYLPGHNDVYVPMNLVKRHGMRKGDAVTGQIKALREGEQPPSRQKFNALVRLDTVNGASPEESPRRVEFGKLTPLYPQQRLRLETEANILTTRIIDLVAPIGKGQRGLIVAPAKAGKTMVMQAVANAITTNNPECHLMVVLVDERPEEVTDMQRAVKGEVIASTFDRPASDHTTVAELAIERAKRLVELGHDVVVLLDSITKLGRAYNLAAPASGRILSGGVDSAALYPPKKFFGAARNIENGGSLTILATALVETGSKMDEVIFEEFKGTGNMELKLDRQLANRRIFPAVDVNASGTRREEILLGQDELKIMWKLRRVLAALDQQQGIELLLDRLKKTKSNPEFLMQVQQTSSIKLDDED